MISVNRRLGHSVHTNMYICINDAVSKADFSLSVNEPEKP